MSLPKMQSATAEYSQYADKIPGVYMSDLAE